MKRRVRVDGEIAYVPLTQGYEAIIDADDAPLVSGRNWYADVRRRRDGTIRNVYAMSGDWLDGKKSVLYIHRLILKPNGELDADHCDGNGLNNRKRNLRQATRSQNLQNISAHKDSASGVKGVYLCKGTGKWRAEIRCGAKRYKLGRFYSVDDASAAYAEACNRLHGEFGRVS